MLTWSFIFLFCVCKDVSGQIRYSILEELERGALVGNVAKDLDLDAKDLAHRKPRIMSETSEQYFMVNLDNGNLGVNVKIDREKLCGQSYQCVLSNEIMIDNPVEFHSVEVEILDINDNSPSFSNQELRLEIVESVAPGTSFLLPSAHDPDVGTNSISTYHLNANRHFALEVKNSRGGSITAVLVLTKSLDREEEATHRLLLTAIDGGTPVRSGTAKIIINVLDVDDNWPVFDQAVYKVKLPENVPIGTLVITLNASDLDEGSNADINYFFSSSNPSRVRDLFSLGAKTGEMRIKGTLDFEESSFYEINIEAKDSVHFTLCKVMVEISDVNDNAPELTLLSVTSPIREDEPIGTFVALMRVTDRDSAENRQTRCHIPMGLPFDLKTSKKNTNTLITSRSLDREVAAQYTIDIVCTDSGTPRLSANKTILVQISDVNDNAPRFAQGSYTVYVPENNPAGSSIGSVSALDPDQSKNSHVTYSIVNSQIQNVPVSAYISINSDTGVIYSQRSFDYEEVKNFQVLVQARDAGSPTLDGNVTLKVIILDQNDNAPQVVSPLTKNNSEVRLPRSADPGSLVTKVVAVDADSGQNARLSYQLLQATDLGLFIVAPSSGEIRTARPIVEKDDSIHRLVVAVRDNGHPPLSTTVTINLLITDSGVETLRDQTTQPRDNPHGSNLAFYLIITLASTSSILLVVLIVLIVTMCHSDGRGSSCCESSPSCCNLRRNDTFPNPHVYLQTVPDYKGSPHFVELVGNGSLSRTYSYKVRPNQLSNKDDFLFLAPYNAATLQNDTGNTDTLLAEWRRGLTSEWKNLSSEVGQLNTDWHSSDPHIVGKISSQGLEENLTQDEIKREFNRRHTALTSGADMDYIKASPDLEDGIPSWAPRFASQNLETMEADEHQSNIYIGGSPVMLACKPDKAVKQDRQPSASSTKKKKKRSKRSEKRESKSTTEEPLNE